MALFAKEWPSSPSPALAIRHRACLCGRLSCTLTLCSKEYLAVITAGHSLPPFEKNSSQGVKGGERDVGQGCEQHVRGGVGLTVEETKRVAFGNKPAPGALAGGRLVKPTTYDYARRCTIVTLWW